MSTTWGRTGRATTTGDVSGETLKTVVPIPLPGGDPSTFAI